MGRRRGASEVDAVDAKALAEPSCTRSGKRFKLGQEHGQVLGGQSLQQQRQVHAGNQAGQTRARTRQKSRGQRARMQHMHGAGPSMAHLAHAAAPSLAAARALGQPVDQEPVLDLASMASLPPLVLQHIASHLPAQSWVSAASVCRAMRGPMLQVAPTAVHVKHPVRWLHSPRNSSGCFPVAAQLQQQLARGGVWFGAVHTMYLDLGGDQEPRWPSAMPAFDPDGDDGSTDTATAQAFAGDLMQGISASLASSWPTLHTLKLTKATRAVSVAALSAVNQIQTLDLTSCKLRSADMPALAAGLTQLHTLKLSLPLPEPQHLAGLSAAAALRVLDCDVQLSHGQLPEGQLSAGHFPVLGALTQLTSLQLRVGVWAMGYHSMRDMVRAEPRDMAHISKLSRLASLALPVCTAKDSDGEAESRALQQVLSGLPSLCTLRLQVPCPEPQLLQAVSVCRGLQSLQVAFHHGHIRVRDWEGAGGPDARVLAQVQRAARALSRVPDVSLVLDKLDSCQHLPWVRAPNVSAMRTYGYLRRHSKPTPTNCGACLACDRRLQQQRQAQQDGVGAAGEAQGAAGLQVEEVPVTAAIRDLSEDDKWELAYYSPNYGHW